MIRQRIRDVRVRAVGRLDLNYQIGPRGTSPEILAWGYSVIRSTEYGTEDQDKAKKAKRQYIRYEVSWRWAIIRVSDQSPSGRKVQSKKGKK